MEPIDHSYPEPQNVSPMQTGVRFGIILALIGMVVQLLTHLTGGANPENADSGLGSIIGCLSIIITISVIVMAIKTHRDKVLGGFISFGQGMGVMFWLALVYGIFTAITNWLYTNVVAPESQDRIKKLIEKTRARVEDGEAQEIELTVLETTLQVFNNPMFVLVITFVVTMVIGAIVSLILTRSRPIGY